MSDAIKINIRDQRRRMNNVDRVLMRMKYNDAESKASSDKIVLNQEADNTSMVSNNYNSTVTMDYFS